MANRFCENCGASRLPDARFCVECGEPVGGAAAGPRRALGLSRYAPALVLATVVVAGGTAVWVGTWSAKPPVFVPPRDQPSRGGDLPAGHPPVSLPDDVRQRIEQMTKEAAARPDDLKLWNQLGMVQYRAGQYEQKFLDDAATTYQHVLDRETTNLDALQALGNIAFDRNQAAQAIDYYQRYLAQRPDDPYVRTNMGTMYLAAHKPAEAVESYEQALRLDPTFFQAQFSLAVAYRATGDGTKALDALQKARSLAPDEATRAQVDTIFERLTSAGPQPGAGGGAPPPPAPGGQAATFRSDVEAVFRAHPIVGPKLDRIDWPDERTAKVFLHDFPMDSMPEFARQKLVDRIKTSVAAGKTRYQITETVRVELIDSGSGRMMETVTN